MTPTAPALLAAPGRWTVADGLLAFVSPPRVDAQAVEAYTDAFEAARAALGEWVGVLLDVRCLEQLDATARSVIYRRGPALAKDPAAVVGRGGIQRVLFQFVFAAIRHRRWRYFTRVEEAVSWLRGQGSA